MVDGGGKAIYVSQGVEQEEKASKSIVRMVLKWDQCVSDVRSSCFACARNKHEHDGSVSCGC